MNLTKPLPSSSGSGLPNCLEGWAALATDLSARKRAAKETADREWLALEAADAEQAAVTEAAAVARAIAATIQATAHNQIASVVTRCLRTSGWDYDFRIQFVERRGKTEAELTFIKDGNECSPLEASSGGAVDVAAFALRLTSLVLSRPARRRLIVLDEPFKFVSAEYRAAVAGLLQALAAELGVQLLLVTHIKEFQLGKVVQL